MLLGVADALRSLGDVMLNLRLGNLGADRMETDQVMGTDYWTQAGWTRLFIHLSRLS